MSFVRREDQRSVSSRQVQGGQGEAQFKAILENADELMGKGRLFSHVKLEKGCSMGWHVHQNEGEAYYILKGQGEYSDNGTIVPVSAGDVTMVYSGEGHSLLNTGDETLELIALIIYE
ncbi:MAG: cupin domain-containing protein [Oscillospiraceae bacterium]|nr:cupin domain-containing protein [Oscillospiraceae bacterium]